VIAVTLTGSPSDAIARTPTHRFVPRSQIKHSYGFAVSSGVRQPLLPPSIYPIFITIVVRNARGTLLATLGFGTVLSFDEASRRVSTRRWSEPLG
jgi:hypothetical protein